MIPDDDITHIDDDGSQYYLNKDKKVAGADEADETDASNDLGKLAEKHEEAVSGVASWLAKHQIAIAVVLVIACVAMGAAIIFVSLDKPKVPNRDCDMKNSVWSEWSECNKECGGGISMRRRTGDIPALGNGKSCPVDVEVKPCNTDPCITDYVMGVWGAWSNCSESCGPGVETRKTVGDQQDQSGGKTAQELMEEINASGGHEGLPVQYDEVNKNFYQTKQCEIVPCPIDCIVDWYPVEPIENPESISYLNPKWNPATEFPFMEDGNPNPLYIPKWIDNPDREPEIDNPLYDVTDDAEIPNPHYDPDNPINNKFDPLYNPGHLLFQTEYIPNPYAYPEKIPNPNYNPDPTIPLQILNPEWEPKYLTIPTNPWEGSRPREDGWSYCQTDDDCPIDNPDCSKYLPCGSGGYQTRTGIIRQPPEHGGQSCGVGPAYTIDGGIATYGAEITEKRSCNQSDCPVDCKPSLSWDIIPDPFFDDNEEEAYSSLPSSKEKDNQLRLKGFELCDKDCIDITSDTKDDIGKRTRRKSKSAAQYGGDECDPDDLIESVPCNNFRCPDIRDYLGAWQALEDYDFALNDVQTDFIPFKSFVVYFDPTIAENNPENGEKKNIKNGFYNIYLNIKDLTNNFSNVTKLIMGHKDVENYKLQFYDNMDRLYTVTLETPTQMVLHMQNLLTHDEYNVSFKKINNTSVTIPGLGTKYGWRYNEFDLDNDGTLPSDITGIPYDDILNEPLPSPTNWVYQTAEQVDSDTTLLYLTCDYSYLLNKDNNLLNPVPHSFYCPYEETRIPFDFELYKGKWQVAGTGENGIPAAFYNIIKEGNNYLMYYTKGAAFTLKERTYLPHLLRGADANEVPDKILYFVLHGPQVNGEELRIRRTGYRMNERDNDKLTYDPELKTFNDLIWVGDVSRNNQGDLVF